MKEEIEKRWFDVSVHDEDIMSAEIREIEPNRFRVSPKIKPDIGFHGLQLQYPLDQTELTVEGPSILEALQSLANRVKRKFGIKAVRVAWQHPDVFGE
jgi:hypothetical protein